MDLSVLWICRCGLGLFEMFGMMVGDSRTANSEFEC